MDFAIEKKGNYLVVMPAGDLKTAEAREFEALLLEQAEKEHQMILDLQNVSYISSSGLRALLAAQQAVDETEDGELILRNVAAEVQDVLSSTGFLNVLTIL